VSATLTIAVSGAFVPIPGWEHWANPVMRGIVVFVVIAVGLWGGLWLGYPPMSVDLGTNRIRWRGVEAAFDELVEFEVWSQGAYVQGRLTTRNGKRGRMILHGEPTAGIGPTGRALLARVLQGSSIAPPARDPNRRTLQEALAVEMASDRGVWRSLGVGEAVFELTGDPGDDPDRPLRTRFIRSHVADEVRGVTTIRIVGLVLICTGAPAAFFLALFALLPPYFERGWSSILFVVSILIFTAGVWCFSLAKARLQRFVLQRAKLRPS
jgi:hypothetical protein